MALFKTPSLLISALLLSGAATAQSDREMTEPTDKHTFFNLTAAGIATLANQGYRLSDLEVVSAIGNSRLFSGTAVRNTGEYQSAWTWCFDKTPLQLLSIANQNSARLIDVERYTVGNSILYAGVMVDNSGPDPIEWYLWPEVSYADFTPLVTNAQARVIDVEYHEVNGENRLTVLAVRNTGPQQKTWWYAIDYTLPFIEDMLNQNHARLVDLERIAPNRYAAIMIEDTTTTRWQYWGIGAATVLERENYHLARTFDLEMYLDNGTPRYLALMIDNFENFSSYGTACATSQGPLQQDVTQGTGFIGSSVTYRGVNFVPSTLGVLNLGFNPTSLSLGILGLPACTLYTAPEVVLPLSIGANGISTQPVMLPQMPSLVGLSYFTQFIALDRAAGLAGVATSNGIVTRVRG